MQLSHVSVTMPSGAEDTARAFYGGLLGLREIPKPDTLRARGGVWFALGSLEIHLSIEDEPRLNDARRHFGLESPDVDGLRRRLEEAGVPTEDGRPAPWKRFFVLDPFGNRIEIHDVGGLHA
jgi:catechol 2,3-dioxygenase-like lactoylglutathione lyase family enzyme